MPDPRPLPRTLDQLSRADVAARVATLRALLAECWALTDSQRADPFECIGAMKKNLLALEAELRAHDAGLSGADQRASA